MNGNERTDPEHVVVLHRWRDRHARYAAYLDHRTQRVTYVTTDLGRSSVPEGAAAVRTVRATDDPVETRAAVAELIGRFGPASRLVALNEETSTTRPSCASPSGCRGRPRRSWNVSATS